MYLFWLTLTKSETNRLVYLVAHRLDFLKCIFNKKTMSMNIWIYSYQKNNTNEYRTIFVTKRLYEYDTKNICIGKIQIYSNICHTLCSILYLCCILNVFVLYLHCICVAVKWKWWRRMPCPGALYVPDGCHNDTHTYITCWLPEYR